MADPPIVVEQVVRDDDAGDVSYRVRIGPDGASVLAHPPTGSGAVSDLALSDLALVTDRATAWELHEGRLRAQDALARGSLKVRGAAEVLTGQADLLARLDHAFAAVRAGTTFAGDR